MREPENGMSIRKFLPRLFCFHTFNLLTAKAGRAMDKETNKKPDKDETVTYYYSSQLTHEHGGQSEFCL